MKTPKPEFVTFTLAGKSAVKTPERVTWRASDIVGLVPYPTPPVRRPANALKTFSGQAFIVHMSCDEFDAMMAGDSEATSAELERAEQHRKSSIHDLL